jgi:hypothetical protein
MAKKRAQSTGVRGDSEKLIGYCGLYCGDCSGYKGTIANLACDLNRELKRERFGELAASLSKVPFFKSFEHYPQCCEVLRTLPKLRCRKTCRRGGGPPECGIRQCSRERRLDGCWQCGEFKTCSKLDFLKAGHGDAHLKNLAKIKRAGTKAFLQRKRLWRTKAGSR